MAIKDIAAVLKANKAIYVFRGKDGVQWVSDGTAAYPLPNCPQITNEDEAKAVFSAGKEWTYRELGDEFLDTSDFAVMEYDVEPLHGIRVIWHGDELLPIVSGSKLYWIKTSKLTPVKALDRTYFVRQSRTGGEIIAVKSGMFLQALIAPWRGSADEEERLSRVLNVLSERQNRAIDGAEA